MLSIIQHAYLGKHPRLQRHLGEFHHSLDVPCRIDNFKLFHGRPIFRHQQLHEPHSRIDLRRMLQIKPIPIQNAGPSFVSILSQHVVHVLQNTFRIIISFRLGRMRIKYRDSALLRHFFKRMARRIRRTRWADFIHCLWKDSLLFLYPFTHYLNQFFVILTFMRLLVTGGYGFIGSNFINFYIPLSSLERIINVDAMYYSANEAHVAPSIRADPRYIHYAVNLQNKAEVERVLREEQPTHVIHFAAQSHVQRSFDDSLAFTYDNVLGTHMLIECCRVYGGIQRFIHVSTDEVYGESMNTTEELHKTEKSILCPTNPYAATKAGAELIVQAYAHSYKMPIIITRGNNVYGPNQHHEKVIPRFIQQLKRGEKVTIQGNGTAVRGFLHARDTAEAFALILERGVIGEIYNIGTEEECSVLDLARLLIRLIRRVDTSEDIDSWITYIEDRPFNDQRYYISNEKLKGLGWSVKTDFVAGLKQLIQ